MKMRKTLFGKYERGVAMLEYALLASLLSVAAMSAVSFLGSETQATFFEAGDTIHDAVAGKDFPDDPPVPG